MQIGAQFYTIRDFCKTPEDLALSLRKVADIGYKTVQISGTCPYDPQWLKEQLDATGLKCVLTHIPAQRLQEEAAQVAKDHDVFGCDYVGLGAYGFKEEKGESLEGFVNIYTPVAKALKEGGKYFMYHNHASEFVKIDGKTVIEQLANDFAPDIMGFTLDTYWIQAGGADPAKIIEMLSGRVPCIHLKDYAFGPKMAAIGEGNINFDRVFEKAEAGGTRYMLVEQDDCNGEDPFKCLRRSYLYLRANGFR